FADGRRGATDQSNCWWRGIYHVKLYSRTGVGTVLVSYRHAVKTTVALGQVAKTKEGSRSAGQINAIFSPLILKGTGAQHSHGELHTAPNWRGEVGWLNACIMRRLQTG